MLHTINPRLHPDQIVYIGDHAEDQVLFFDMTFLPLIQAVARRAKTIRHYVAMTDRAHMPAPEVAATIPGLLCYEDLMGAQDDAYTWPCLLYTSRQPAAAALPTPTLAQVKQVVDQRCTLCHNAAVQQKNVALHTPDLIRQHAQNVYQQVAVLKVMPLNLSLIHI